MGDNAEGEEAYRLIAIVDGNKVDLPHSHGYKGEGTANYPNKEIYEGFFDEGVTTFWAP